MHGNQFIADLMPTHPVYVALLPEAARRVIGLPHPSGRAAMRMLENEGFAYECYVDIFDGGPTMTARTDQVASIRDAAAAQVTGTELQNGERVLLAAGHLADFRCCFGTRKPEGGGIAIDAAAAGQLRVQGGDTVWSIGR
jgi:arginine N-succinyltransferase